MLKNKNVTICQTPFVRFPLFHVEFALGCDGSDQSFRQNTRAVKKSNGKTLTIPKKGALEVLFCSAASGKLCESHMCSTFVI